MTVTHSNQEFAITHQADPQGPGTADQHSADAAASAGKAGGIPAAKGFFPGGLIQCGGY